MLEKSCGAVLYTIENNEILYLLVRDSRGICGLPKGHVEPGETEVETALRVGNTPTKKVEDYLNNYQTLESNVLAELDSIVNNEEMFDEDQKVTYRDILKKHYQDLTYTIKEETVNGDKATVEAEIEVTDYTKALEEAQSYRTTNESEFLDENNEFDEAKFNTYK